MQALNPSAFPICKNIFLQLTEHNSYYTYLLSIIRANPDLPGILFKEKQVRLKIFPLYCAAILLFFLIAPSAAYGDTPVKKGEALFEWDGDVLKRMLLDTSGNGKVDYIVNYNKAGQKILEEMDYNGDGSMDDFYYYENEVLVRREIDSNYDGRIDIWVYLTEGMYIRRYERDTNFDGEPDQIKVFGD